MSDAHEGVSTEPGSDKEHSAPAAPVQAVAKKQTKYKTVLATAAALVVVAGLIAVALSSESGSLTALVARDATVATVDGEKITRSELDERLSQVRGPDAQGAPDAAEEQQALEDLVNMRLILNIARNANITVTDEEVATEIATLVQNFGDQAALDAQLAAVGITQDKLKENIRQELTIRKVVDANTTADEIVVTDEEVRAYYDDNGIAAMEQAPQYEELVPFIRDQLIQQKTGELLNEYLTKLRGEADVELLLK